ncbi:binding-protein-dependent transporters inner membrane component [Natrialba chahannaoensis JCM 10990]|uniref:Binding-protein-dependent transporters inner membrane component n=1 Tax=Natrialba chahannaoensis JCM 10990 TaxID=1227492 RepID=M0A9W0_9EURY|nr:ABC transporter permease [Natrialba chahannaoensis]ELY94687.1 binding-protein-dependent transporters inner membrane component [Natrialba chahannaoensis JCM 10990]
MSMNEFDDKTLRERIAKNPQPALAWLAGALVLVVLELGRLASGIVQVGETTRFVLGGIASVPGSVEESVASTLGGIAGLVAFGLTVLVLLGIAAILVKWLLIPWTLVDRLGIEASTGVKDIVERVIVTGLLVVAAALVVLTPVGGVLEMAVSALTRGVEWVGSLPTITSRELIPNEGYQQPDGSWEGTFLGLSPAVAWALRVAVVYAYALVWLAWLWRGYETFREHYREADWTPRDDSINRFRNHYWGMFGLIVVIMFLVMALWAPAVSPATAEANLYQPYEHEFEYYGDDGVETISHGDANFDSRSQGSHTYVSVMSYDDYDRFHPFGTNTDGKDLFTFLAYGAQVSLVIGLLATVLMAVIATALALITAYYKGVADLVTIVASDSIISLPRFLLVLLLSVLFMQANHPVAEIYDGGLLLALIFAGTGWPLLWRAVRGPALQVSEQEWIDAAKSYGQSPAATMRKHMAPYIAGYMLIYASLSLGGVIIGVAALSFLGFGVQAPTPEWGRAVYEGRSHIDSPSWHIATLPGILVVLLVTGFNALGDGIRDAIDPQSEASDGAAGASGGGG